MCNDALKDIYRAVVLARLLSASPACWGLATTSDKQRIEAFVRQGVQLGLYGDSHPTRTQVAEDAHEAMFERIRYNKRHVLQQFLPEHSYSIFDLDVTTSSCAQKLTNATL